MTPNPRPPLGYPGNQTPFQTLPYYPGQGGQGAPFQTLPFFPPMGGSPYGGMPGMGMPGMGPGGPMGSAMGGMPFGMGMDPLGMLFAQYMAQQGGINQAMGGYSPAGYGAPVAPPDMSFLKGMFKGGAGPGEQGAARGLFGSIQSGVGNELAAGAAAGGTIQGGYQRAGDIQGQLAQYAALKDYLSGSADASMQMLQMAQQQQQGQQQAATGLFDQVSQFAGRPGVTPEQINAFIQAASGAEGMGGAPWLGGLASAFGGAGGGLSPTLQSNLSNLVQQAYASGKSSYADVHKFVTDAMIQGAQVGGQALPGDPYTYLSQRQAIDSWLENWYQQTNGMYGPGGSMTNGVFGQQPQNQAPGAPAGSPYGSMYGVVTRGR